MTPLRMILLATLVACAAEPAAEPALERIELRQGAACREGAPPPGTFTESATALGVDFVHSAFPPVDPEEAPGDWMVEDLSGAAIADLDGDGNLDLAFADGAGALALYLTGGRGPAAYQRRTLDLEDPTRVVTAGDLDGDGITDLAVVTRGEPVWLRGLGDGAFAPPAPLLGESAPDVSVFSIALGDLSADGWPDLLLGGQNLFDEAAGLQAPGPELLLLNTGGSFADASALIPSQSHEDLTYLAMLADLDDDGDLDVYEINDARDKGEAGGGNRLLRNDGVTGGAVRLEDVTAASGADLVTSGMGGALGDYDNDGLLDLYVTAMTPDVNVLLRNTGGLVFEDVTETAGADTLTPEHDVGWGAVFFDADSDGWLDLFVVHGFIETSDFGQRMNDPDQPNVLLRNRADGTFEDVTGAAGAGGPARSRSPVVGDLNRDGFPDLVVGNVDVAPYVYLNGCDDRPWLTVRLDGEAPNRRGFGARIRATAGDLTQTRPMHAGSDGLYGSSAPEAYFGFPPGTEAVTVEVRWPGGAIERYEDLPVRHHVTLRP